MACLIYDIYLDCKTFYLKGIIKYLIIQKRNDFKPK